MAAGTDGSLTGWNWASKLRLGLRLSWSLRELDPVVWPGELMSSRLPRWPVLSIKSEALRGQFLVYATSGLRSLLLVSRQSLGRGCDPLLAADVTYQVKKKTAECMGMLVPLLNRKSDISVRNGVLLYKQLIRPMMDYACPAWRSAARTHIRRLKVLYSKCLPLASGTLWYVTGKYIRI